MSHTIRAVIHTEPSRLHRRWRVHVLRSPDATVASKTIDVGYGDTVLGRSAGVGMADVPIDDRRLSRRHVALRVDVQSEKLQIEDLKSSNGTWIDGKRIERMELAHGSVVRLGNTVIVVARDNGKAPDFVAPSAGIPGQSEQARILRELVSRMASNVEPLLVWGPAGSGKGRIARALHKAGKRGGNKVAVRMEELATDDAHEAVFGTSQRTGLLDKARGGTLILERIENATPSMQSALRAVLADPRRLREEDVRIIALSRRSLLDRAESGNFDFRLAETLSMHAIYVPPLSARRVDLIHLADAVVPLEPARRQTTWAEVLDADAAELLLHYRWPNNLTELRKMLAPLARRDDQSSCGVSTLPTAVVREVRGQLHGAPRRPRSTSPSNPTRPRYTAVQLCHLLAVHGGISQMAKALGCSREALMQTFQDVEK